MTLPEKLIVMAVAMHVALAFYVLVRMGMERVPRVLSGEIAMRDIALEGKAYPLKARLLSNNFDNQFQLPTAFHIAALISLWSGQTGWAEVAIAFVFVALRFAHSVIHTGSNNLLRRFRVYTAGFAILGLFWLVVVVRVLLAPGLF